MSLTTLRIVTRESALALWQAHFVRDSLLALEPQLNIEVIGMTTQGDKRLETSLSKVGGKGLFTKELQEVLLRKEADIAVHSAKDMTVTFPEGLGLAAVCESMDPRDAFVSNHYGRLTELPEGSRVGTSSLRRQALIRSLRPDLTILPLRGNVNTRLRKLDEGEFDAIILAASGLMRLGFEDRIRERLSIEDCLPAVGQGVLGIECCLENRDAWMLVEKFQHTSTRYRLLAERAMNQRLNGGCQVPIAGYAELKDAEMWLRGLVAEPDGSRILRAEARGHCDEAEHLGEQVAESLLKQGAHAILEGVYGM